MKHLQMLAYSWAVRAFGARHVNTSSVRALRLVEEAIELAQAEHVSKEMIDRCTEVVYSRPAGHHHQELGGVIMTAAIYAEQKGYKLEDVLTAELNRVLSKPLEHFAHRNDEKLQLGLTGNIDAKPR